MMIVPRADGEAMKIAMTMRIVMTMKITMKPITAIYDKLR